jgi:hypothetical protein
MVGVENYCAFLDRFSRLRPVRVNDSKIKVAPSKGIDHHGTLRWTNDSHMSPL